MKKIKTVKKFYFKNEDVDKCINRELPLSLKDIEFLIDKIHLQYPALDKTEISIIIKSVFETLRLFLINGNVLNLNKFLFDTKLFFYQRKIKGKETPHVKIKTKTPNILKP